MSEAASTTSGSEEGESLALEQHERFRREHSVAETELVIGLAGAVGTNLDAVCEALPAVLDGFSYGAREIRLSALLDEIDWEQSLKPEPLDEHIGTYMDAGLELRRRWQHNDALARLAITRLVNERRELDGDGSRQAWILRSLKRPEEVQTLRDVYGTHFVLIGVYTPEQERLQELTDKIRKDHQAERGTHARWEKIGRALMARDEAEGQEAHGQRLRNTFHLADFFIECRKDVDLEEADDLKRIFEILLGSPFRTPTKDEAGLLQAAAAARRSAEPGRQVGAALATQRGELLSVGCNEVPRYKGGPYWEDDDYTGPVQDAREFKFEQPADGPKYDTINIFRREIAEEIATALKDTEWVSEDATAEGLFRAIESTRFGDLTEFGRAVHAEMAAILEAARTGRSIGGATLYVDTFPCHNCARHIIAAGIERVVYVSPYAKSQAARLHPDALAVASEHPNGRVSFDPFVGVAPRRYMDLFYGLRRKDDDGRLVDWQPGTAKPRFPDAEPASLRQNRPPYRVHEDLVIRTLLKVQLETGLGVRGASIGPVQAESPSEG